MGRYIIPFDPSGANVLLGQDFPVELDLAQIWKPEDINRITGQWGYLRINIVCNGKPAELWYEI